VTVTPGGTCVKIRSLAWSVPGLIGLEKATNTPPGRAGIVSPLRMLVSETRSCPTAFRAAGACTRPNPPCGSHDPFGVPFSGRVEAMKALRMSAEVAVGAICFSNAATAARFGADDDVPKKFGSVSGSWLMSPPKNDVLFASGPETSGFSRTSGDGRRLPAGSMKIVAGPNELNGSLRIGVGVANGGARKNGTAPTPMASLDTGWPKVVG
jgi:hypothetical protein